MKIDAKLLPGLLALALVAGLNACQNAASSDSKSPAAAVPGGITVFGTVGGRILGPDGHALPGISVTTTTGSASRDIVSQVTDAKGFFEIKNLISGEHTIYLGDGVSSTTENVTVHIPNLNELKTAAQLSVVTDANGNKLNDPSMITASGGPYFVNVNIKTGKPTDDATNAATADVFYLYPCTATITGFATIRKPTDTSASLAVAAGSGTKVVADFAAWNGGNSLLFIGTVSDAATGAFSIANVPAVFNSISNSSRSLGGGTIDLYLVSEGSATGVNSVPLSGFASNTSSSSSSISDGATLPGDSRSVGTLVFVAGLAPNIVTYSPAADSVIDPGTATAPTPIVLTFDQAMNPAKGSYSVSSSSPTATLSADVAASWNTSGTANTILTLQPLHNFAHGASISISLSGYQSAAGVPLASSSSYISYAIRPAFALVSDNAEAYSSPAVQEFPVSGTDIALTFNYPVAFVDMTATNLAETASGATVDAAPTATAAALAAAPAATISIHPAAALKYNTGYTLSYSVRTNLFQGSDRIASGTLQFTTAPDNSALGPVTLALNSVPISIAVLPNRYTYNNGDATVFVSYTKIAGADSYSYQYRYDNESAWQTVTGLTPSETNGTLDYAPLYLTAAAASAASSPLTIPADKPIDPGKTLDIRVVALKSSLGVSTSVSNVIQVKDTTAPASAGVAAVTGSFNNSAVGAKDAIVKLDIQLGGAEPMATPTLAQFATSVTGGNLTFSSVSISTDQKTIYLYCSVKAGQNLTGGTNTITISLSDANNNPLDTDSATAGNQGYIYSIP